MYHYQEEQAHIIDRVHDLFEAVWQKQFALYSPFWNEQQLAYAKEEIAKNRFENYLFFGGIAESERKILGVFPSSMEPVEDRFPICAFSFAIPKGFKLCHRDVLGSLMALELKRDHIGDILMSNDYGAFFVKESVAPLIKQELHKIGCVGISLKEGVDLTALPGKQFREITGTVASLRLDAIVALIAGCSREKAVEKIKTGTVFCNYFPTLVPRTEAHPGDLISIRGYGKFLLDNSIRPTKKGRLFLTIHQYI